MQTGQISVTLTGLLRLDTDQIASIAQDALPQGGVLL